MFIQKFIFRTISIEFDLITLFENSRVFSFICFKKHVLRHGRFLNMLLYKINFIQKRYEIVELPE